MNLYIQFYIQLIVTYSILCVIDLIKIYRYKKSLKSCDKLRDDKLNLIKKAKSGVFVSLFIIAFFTLVFLKGYHEVSHLAFTGLGLLFLFCSCCVVVLKETNRIPPFFGGLFLIAVFILVFLKDYHEVSRLAFTGLGLLFLFYLHFFVHKKTSWISPFFGSLFLIAVFILVFLKDYHEVSRLAFLGLGLLFFFVVLYKKLAGFPLFFCGLFLIAVFILNFLEVYHEVSHLASTGLILLFIFYLYFFVHKKTNWIPPFFGGLILLTWFFIIWLKPSEVLFFYSFYSSIYIVFLLMVSDKTHHYSFLILISMLLIIILIIANLEVLSVYLSACIALLLIFSDKTAHHYSFHILISMLFIIIVSVYSFLCFLLLF